MSSRAAAGTGLGRSYTVPRAMRTIPACFVTLSE